MLARVALSLCLIVPAPLSAQDYADGRAAYAARDWDAAEALWVEEAATGSPEALLGLGNIYDFGLLGEAEPARAFDLYQRAATAGLSEAAFNVAVMHDSGTGTPEDAQAAAAWYGFAALGGSARAAYNLGQLFADGIGVPQNPRLAAHWFGVAEATLPAAGEALAVLDTSSVQDAPLSAPLPLAAEIFARPDGEEVRLAWQDDGSPSGASYRVDLIRLGSDAASLLAARSTPGSAVAVGLPSTETRFAWRVAQVSDDAYAASDWQDGDGIPLPAAPVGIVRFEYASGDRRAEGLALRLGGAMERFGTLVDYAGAERAPAASGAVYGFAQDAAFASDVATFLPGSGPDGAVLRPGLDFAPGEVRVALAFDDEG